MTCDRLWFTLGIPVSSTNKTDCHDIAEKLLKVALNTIILTLNSDLISVVPLVERGLVGGGDYCIAHVLE